MKSRAWSLSVALVALAVAPSMSGCAASEGEADDESAAVGESESALRADAYAPQQDLDGVRIRVGASVNDALRAGFLRFQVGLHMESRSTDYPHPFAIDAESSQGVHDGVFVYGRAANGYPDPLDAKDIRVAVPAKRSRADGGFVSLSFATFDLAPGEVPKSGDVHVQLTTLTDLVESPYAANPIHEGGPQCQLAIHVEVGADGKLIAGKRATVKSDCRWPGP